MNDQQPSPRTILVADDDPVNRRLASILLSRAGHDAVLVQDGLEALSALTENQFDLVLLDVNMPGCNGPELAARIRHGEAGPDRANTRLVALTGFSDKCSLETCLEAGMDGVIVKPLCLEALERWLETAPECAAPDFNA